MLCMECSAARGSQHQRSRGTVESAVSGVIVDDLLCYAVSKMDVVVNDLLAKVCCETYMDEDIQNSKKLLYEVCDPGERCGKRQGAGKSMSNMTDILKVLHTMDPDQVLIFASVAFTRDRPHQHRCIPVPPRAKACSTRDGSYA